MLHLFLKSCYFIIHIICYHGNAVDYSVSTDKPRIQKPFPFIHVNVLFHHRQYLLSVWF